MIKVMHNISLCCFARISCQFCERLMHRKNSCINYWYEAIMQLKFMMKYKSASFAQLMKIQLSQYFQQALPKHTFIDTTIAPLLATVKQRKINSIHQLRTNLYHSQYTGQVAQTSLLLQTVPVFSKNRDSQLKKQSFSYSQRESPSIKPKLASTIDSYGKASKAAQNKFAGNPEQRILFINPLSKVKKHLVDSIDFHEIERVMFQKPNKINKYQQFFQSLSLKKRQGRAKTVAKNTRTVKLLETEQAIAKGQLNQTTYTPEESIFRITHRRKFWNTAREQSRRKSPNGLLEINCLVRTFHVE